MEISKIIFTWFDSSGQIDKCMCGCEKPSKLVQKLAMAEISFAD